MKDKKVRLTEDFSSGRIAGLREAANLVSDAMVPLDPHRALGLDKAVDLILKRLREVERAALSATATEGRKS